MPNVPYSTSSDQRAQRVCAYGLVAQLAVLTGTLAIAAWGGSDAIWAEVVHVTGGVAIWLALLLLYTQRKRAGVEAFETDELRRAAEAGASTTIFEAADETLHLERHRLKWFYRWFLPVFTVVLALFHIGMYVRWQVKFGWAVRAPSWTLAENPSLAAVVMAFMGFLCFLVSRYASGMARREEWKMLRAASTYLAGNALACLLLVAALGLRLLNQPLAEPIAAWVIWITILVLGLEFAINFVLDIYRPRVSEAELRPAFDSRLLALISEPGSVAKSIADAINYQFGFEVSATWFYKLMQRALLPLAVFTFLALLALSCVVIVDADQVAVVERFGRPLPDGQIGPGIHVKSPWPVDRVYRVSVCHLRTLMVGAEGEGGAGAEKPAAESPEEIERQVVLWTEKHEFAPHMMVLVADPTQTGLPAWAGVPGVGPAGEPEAEGGQPGHGAGLPADRGGASAVGPAGAGGEAHHHEGRAVGVSMVRASVALQYKARVLRDYLYNYTNPEGVLEAIVYQALTDYSAAVDIDQVIGPGRQAFERGLRDFIQRRVDQLDPPLGIDIAFVGLQGCHPPFEEGVAAAFQNVVAAEIKKDAAIEAARGKAQQVKSEVAGSVERADLLDASIVVMDDQVAGGQATPEELAASRRRVEDLLLGNQAEGISSMSGQAAAEIAKAEADRTVDLAVSRSRQTLFANELRAYQAAPRLYKMRKYLEMWTEVARNIRKVVFLGDRNKTDLIIILEPEKQTVLDLGEPATKK